MATIFLNELKEIDKMLNSPKLILSLKDSSEEEKEDFEEARSNMALIIAELESQVLPSLLVNLKQNEESFQQGINNLKRQIQKFNQIADVTEQINKLIDVIAP